MNNTLKCKDKLWTAKLSQGKYKKCYLVRADKKPKIKKAKISEVKKVTPKVSEVKKVTPKKISPNKRQDIVGKNFILRGFDSLN